MSTADAMPPVPRFAHGSRTPGWDDAADLEKDPAQVPDPATTEVPAELRAQIEDYMSRYPDPRSAVIPALKTAQERYGWCSPEAIEQVACVMQLTPGYVVAVAGFYDQLETQPVGHRPVYVCTNISCSLRGADHLLAQLREHLDGADDVNLRAFECLGACDIAPMVSVEGVYVGPVHEDEIRELARQIRAGENPLPGKQLIDRPCQDPNARAS